MTRKFQQVFAGLAVAGMGMSAAASAQGTSADLMAMEDGALRDEVTMRYEAALAGTMDPAIVSANDTRFTWATEAKAQCAIALGYLKSGTRDATSLSRCAFAYDRFLQTPAPMPPVAAAPPPPPPPPAQVCQAAEPSLVFFEFDSAVPTAAAMETVRFVTTNAANCGWSSFAVTGHTDRAGSDAYNDALAMRRAEAVADIMTQAGIGRAAMTVDARGEDQPRVPTEDGVRNPQNRRVEITTGR